MRVEVWCELGRHLERRVIDAAADATDDELEDEAVEFMNDRVSCGFVRLDEEADRG